MQRTQPLFRLGFRRTAVLRACAPAIASLPYLFAPPDAAAVTRTWTGTSGSWSTSSKWSPAGTPSAGDDALISLAPPSDLTVTFNGQYNSGPAALLSFELNPTNGSTITLLQSAPSSALFAANQIIADTGTATYAQSAGSNTASKNLYLANNPGASASYLLSGGSLTSGDSGSTTSTEYIGYKGTASFAQSGGTHTIRNWLYIGYQGGSSATYSLSGGTLSQDGGAALGSEFVGFAGTGVIVQTGGSHVVARLNLGYVAGSTGSYAISGGSLAAEVLQLSYFFGTGGAATFSLSGTASVTSSAQLIGNSGPATFNQSGGSNSLSSFLILGRKAGITGFYSMSAGTLTSPDITLGYPGSGTFTHTGGVVSLNGATGTLALTLAKTPDSSGLYSLSGTASLYAPFEYVGYAGNGSFLQSAATNAVNSLFLAFSPNSMGTYSLTAGSLSVSNNAYVGGSSSSPGGTGSLLISGGTASVTNTLTVHPTPDSHVSLTSGTLTVGSLSLSSPAALDLSGGTLLLPHAASPTFLADLAAARIVSTAANADPNHLLAIGYTDDGSTLTARLTPLGDANLDGKINADDYALLDRGFAKHLTTWQSGDFNYDGSIDSTDYLLIDRVFLSQAQGFSPGFLADRESRFGTTYVTNLLASLPEPTPLLTACGLALPLLTRRRNRPRLAPHDFA